MIRNTKRTIILIVGVLFLILGVIGLVLPFLQGFLFLAIGLIILSILFPALRDKTFHHTTKFPKVHTVVLKVEDFVKRILGEV